MATGLTKREQARYRAIVQQLSKLSQKGWDRATHDDYAPLEAELAALAEKQVRYKPTKDELRIIRDCAMRGAKTKRVEVNPSTRYNLATKKVSMNVALISNDPDFGDTDLEDNALDWRFFVRGFELTDDGRGIVDFWVYSKAEDGELKTNVTAYWERGRMVRVEEVEAGIMWKAEG